MNRIQYMATVLPGLEAVLADELGLKIRNADNIKAVRGKIYFHTASPAYELYALRTADNLYRIVSFFNAGLHRSVLQQLQKKIAVCDLSFLRETGSGPEGFMVNASRKGTHNFSRFEAAEAAMCGILKQYPNWKRGTPENHSCEFRLDLEGEAGVFAYRLTDSHFRYRCKGRQFVPGSLRPPVAHALVWLSSPHHEDRVIDPCCGSGTLLSERLAYSLQEIKGGDCSVDAVLASRHNLSPGSTAVVHRWDARSLPVDSGWANKIISNLAFGRQVGDRDSLMELYGPLLGEMSRLLMPGGRAILLAEDGALLRLAAARSGLDCSELLRISLKGLQPAIYELTQS
ncbi:RNA methyltransferase [Paenibacillus nasutitermitis]|uniref:Ribosomal RNA large subunit methyltransferase K/L-like methyltransferase domain-containing protein n=1 Tax=Paenibacillus nasutitermitis TaxID=1652958 RepID=A0A916YYH3_9BACL|nr:RNA methyltransferase [Paenibacillus nasutitermitis]GGD67026.1 hypothetical protein GCM10010911_26020 [Paenibacillus nasutitermitis]